MTIALVSLYSFLLIAKAVLVLRYPKSPAHIDKDVTIVQTILSGDPLLEPTLERNLDAHPEAQFLWMIDEEDTEAWRIARKCARPRLQAQACPPPRNGENPKLVKLIRALELVTTQRLTVLDDDTILPGPLPSGALVTGLPVFTAKGSIYERLIGGFVNGSALLTYLPAARLGLQRTINGMIYSVDAHQLRSLGGFAAAGHELTDDYAVARLYTSNRLSITQSTAAAFVAMTITGPGHYVSVMRRWMIFAARYFGDNATVATTFWIALPGLLPLVGFLLQPTVWAVLLPMKALLNRALLWHVTGFLSTGLDLVFECAADLLTPFWTLLAFVRPRRLTWRTRKIEVDAGAIRYK